MIALLALLSQTVEAPPQPVEARVVGVEDRRTTARYQRIEIAFLNRTAAPLSLRSCAADARLDAFRIAGGRMVRSDTLSAFGVSSDRNGNWSSGCREVQLAPGRPVSLAFYVRGVGMGQGARRFTVDTSVGRFVVQGHGVWSQSQP